MGWCGPYLEARKGDRLYRCYVSQAVLKHGRHACPNGRVPFAIRKRGGRKRVLKPDAEVALARPRIDTALAKAIPRAH